MVFLTAVTTALKSTERAFLGNFQWRRNLNIIEKDQRFHSRSSFDHLLCALNIILQMAHFLLSMYHDKFYQKLSKLNLITIMVQNGF